jgi:hypothetical protein
VSAEDRERAAALERRYLRLLRCYPASQREEMLGVLQAAAWPGQRRPGVRQTANLVACGLAIRAHRVSGWLADDSGQDALAVVSLIAPVLMLIIAALDFAVAVRVDGDAAAMARVPVWQLLSFVPTLAGPAAVMIAWLAVVLLGLTGRRRAAAAVASIPLTLALLALVTVVVQWSGAWSGGLPLFLVTAGLVGPAVMASLAACSLAFSPGPQRGLAIAGRRRACLMIAGLAAGFVFLVIIQLVSPTAPVEGPAFSLLGVLVIAFAIVVTRVRGTVGWRVAVLVATGLLANLASTVPLEGDLVAYLVPLLVSLLVAALVWPVAIASWRGRVRRASRAG